MTKPPRARVRQSFEQAAARYDTAADVQRLICDAMAARLTALAPAGWSPQRWLDAGCGTGYALPLLQARYPQAQAFALDLAPAMLGQAGVQWPRIAADIEHLPLRSASIDLYWSSLTVQWCELARVLAEARRVLRPGGRLAVATLGDNTFHELRAAFSSVDPHRHTIAFHNADEITAMAVAADLGEHQHHRRAEIRYFSDLKSLLRSVKTVGANQLGQGRRTGLLSRHAFARAEAAYESLRSPQGLPLTYDVIELHAQV